MVREEIKARSPPLLARKQKSPAQAGWKTSVTCPSLYRDRN